MSYQLKFILPFALPLAILGVIVLAIWLIIPSTQRAHEADRQEYLDTVCIDKESLVPDEGLTWGEATQAGIDFLAVWESVEPPYDLAEYHHSAVAMVRALTNFSYAQPSEEEADFESFVDVQIMLGLEVHRFYSVVYFLSDSQREMLRAHGCPVFTVFD